MKLRYLLALCMTLFVLPVFGGDTLFRCDFLPDQMKDWKLPAEAAIVQDNNRSVLQIKFQGSTPNQRVMAVKELSPAACRGKTLIVSALIKAEKVTKPQARWNGIKVMIHYVSKGKDNWINPPDLHGTFDWKKISATAKIPDDATKCEVMLGMQDSTGTINFAEVRADAYNNEEIFAKIPVPPNFKAEYTSRVTSMPTLRGVMSSSTGYKPSYLEDLAKWKANLIRWQIVRNWGVAGTERDQAEYDKWIDARIAEIDQVLKDAHRLGIMVVIDLHSPPGGRYADRDMAMFYEKPYAEQYIATWKKLAAHFKGNPAVWAYDLINEPVQNKPSAEYDYLTIQYKAAQAIRSIDPETPIMVESNQWDQPATYSYMQPLPLKNIIYQVHMYNPGSFTHQNVSTNWGVKSDKPAVVTYPGLIEGDQWNRDMLRKNLQPVIDFQKKYGVRIYVGEFSAIRWAPGAAKYMEDCLAIFEENHWDWSYHAFREWSGWSVEHSNDPLDKKPTTTDSDRKVVLLKYLQLNQPVK